ncbi:MAG: DUF1800 domain-containing protein [Pseudomonadota bacterium]|nr:DUF1800 domain-containing protein [Pseudomonadota bacterium]
MTIELLKQKRGHPLRAAWRVRSRAAIFGLLVAACTAAGAAAPPDRPASIGEARRFLSMAAFGPNDNDAELLLKIGLSAWIDRQWQIAPTSHRACWETTEAAVRAADPNQGIYFTGVVDCFWKQAINGPDQLRLRTAYALSQIFVISAADSGVNDHPREIAAWLDMLGTDGLTTYRQLLESVARHPQMGRYLSHLRNQKADPTTGRVPDENFGREVMQLFSIGVVKLNLDGSPQLVGGQSVETYGPADVAGMARVFTGFSFECPAFPANGCFYSGSSGGASNPDREWKPMRGYPNFHEKGEKRFLGVTIAAQTVADPDASLRMALDTLAAHPNVAPFISRQLIQRLVTSNPSPTYIRDVATVWNNNGAGVRGDIKAVVKAILTHPESRRVSNIDGKVREPVLRLAAFLRAFPHRSDSGRFRVGETENPGTQLGQTPLHAPSVFNFYRPGYVAPGSNSAAAGMVAPELQLLNETSVAGYVNYMRGNLQYGVGSYNQTINGVVYNRPDLQRDWSQEMEYSTKPGVLADYLITRLLYLQPAVGLRAEVVTAINSIVLPNYTGSNLPAIYDAQRKRVNAALLLVLASPEYLVQK